MTIISVDKPTYHDYANYIKQWPWQWFATLTFHQNHLSPTWIKLVSSSWSRKPCDTNKPTFGQNLVGLQNVRDFRLAWTLELCLKEKSRLDISIYSLMTTAVTPTFIF